MTRYVVGGLLVLCAFLTYGLFACGGDRLTFVLAVGGASVLACSAGGQNAEGVVLCCIAAIICAIVFAAFAGWLAALCTIALAVALVSAISIGLASSATVCLSTRLGPRALLITAP